MNIKRHFKSLLTRFSPKLNIKFNYKFYYKRNIDLNNPKYFDEKIQWLKLNEYHKPVYTICADKLLVRDYVKDKGLGHILNPIIAVYQDVKEINWDILPNKFVIKWNFGNGFNLICFDKNKLNFKESEIKLAKWGKTNSHLIHAEIQYKNIPKRLICEEFIEGKEANVLPEDYKVYCFNGIPKYILVCEGREKGWPKFYFFDSDWNLARINKDSINAPTNFSLPKPDGIDEIFNYAKVLSQDFKFVRVDFYYVNGKVYFGELTFSPSGGFDVYRLPETDLLFGNLLNLKN